MSTSRLEEELHQTVLKWERAANAIIELERSRYELEITINNLMECLDSSEIEINNTKLVRKERVHYEQGLLDPLREYLTPEEVEQLLTAPKPAPARKWNLTKVKSFCHKRGGTFKALLKKATYTEPARVRLNRTFDEGEVR